MHNHTQHAHRLTAFISTLQVWKYKFEIGYSETLETRDGILPASLLLVGKVYPFKEFLKEKFPAIKYTDLVFAGGITKVHCNHIYAVISQRRRMHACM